MTADDRVIELDLSTVDLPGRVHGSEEAAELAAHVYELFVPYADEGWEWIDEPASADFDGWVVDDGGGARRIVGVRLRCRRRAEPGPPRSLHGVSPYRTQQLTERPWTSVPGSKLWSPVTEAPSNRIRPGTRPS